MCACGRELPVIGVGGRETRYDRLRDQFRLLEAMFKQIDTAELSRIQETGPVVLVDVRTDAEVARGYIAGAQHIPLHLLPGRSGELKPEVPTVVYCQSGGRSAQACTWLAEQGFTDVANLQGGIGAWQREGRPVVIPG